MQDQPSISIGDSLPAVAIGTNYSSDQALQRLFNLNVVSPALVDLVMQDPSDKISRKFEEYDSSQTSVKTKLITSAKRAKAALNDAENNSTEIEQLVEKQLENEIVFQASKKCALHNKSILEVKQSSGRKRVDIRIQKKKKMLKYKRKEELLRSNETSKLLGAPTPSAETGRANFDKVDSVPRNNQAASPAVHRSAPVVVPNVSMELTSSDSDGPP